MHYEINNTYIYTHTHTHMHAEIKCKKNDDDDRTNYLKSKKKCIRILLKLMILISKLYTHMNNII